MIKQQLLLLRYNKDVVCIIDKNQDPICILVLSPGRRNIGTKSNIPSHDPYIPRPHSVLYNCSNLSCSPLNLYSITQITTPDFHIKQCFKQLPEKFECETIRYNHLKNVDKLLFLSNNIQNKTFYAVDCLVYPDRGRVCHRKEDDGSHAKLVDTGKTVRPKEPNVLSQEEFICEESENTTVNCDIDAFVPFEEGLKVKESIKISGDVLLNSGSYVVILRKKCLGSWCGFSGNITPSRRSSSWFPKYDPPGGKVYRCYYAKRQQICKVVNRDNMIYNQRGW